MKNNPNDKELDDWLVEMIEDEKRRREPQSSQERDEMSYTEEYTPIRDPRTGEVEIIWHKKQY